MAVFRYYSFLMTLIVSRSTIFFSRYFIERPYFGICLMLCHDLTGLSIFIVSIVHTVNTSYHC